MNTQEANDFVRTEKARWLARQGISDHEMLRRREQLLNALAMVFALLALVSFFWAGFPGWGVWSWYFAVAGAVVAARQCSTHANKCRDVREFLQAGA